MNPVRILAIVAVIPSLCMAQSDAVVMGVGGHELTLPMRLAPGEIATFYLSGLTPTGAARATATPLPTTLAGISGTMTQSFGPTGPFALPIVAVFPVTEGCIDEPCIRVTGVTVQIPFELVPQYPACGSCNNVARIFFSDGTRRTGWVYIAPVPDRIRVLERVATHADGRPVSSALPALVGEELVMYATGLGPAAPQPKTGEATSSAAPIADGKLVYDFRVNASPAATLVSGSDPYLRFVGMSPGSIGLYQVNFVVPPPPAGLPECGEFAGSNLTVTLMGVTSFDGARICVRIPAP